MTEENNQNGSKKRNSKENEINTFTSAQRAEYFGKLEKWLIEAYAWQNFAASFPYYLASSHMLNIGNSANPNNLTTNSGPTISNAQINNSNSNNQEELRQRREPTAPQFQVAGVQVGCEYRIPSIWKRFAAELIDSVILLLLKILITYIIVDIFDFIDIEKYPLDILQTNLRIDYKMALELTSGILILEFIHRLSVCVFEAVCLQHGRNGRVGGATPGKSFMGLKVVQCQNITPIARLDNNTEIVFVTPGNDLGLFPALGRAVLKNLILAFFFPVSFALCFFRFNRTVYDLVCNSIVVEDPYRNGNNNINNNNNNVNNNNVFNLNRANQ